jgi:hypothetical protein
VVVVCLDHVLLQHALGSEKRPVQRNRMPHDAEDELLRQSAAVFPDATEALGVAAVQKPRERAIVGCFFGHTRYCRSRCCSRATSATSALC